MDNGLVVIGEEGEREEVGRWEGGGESLNCIFN